MIQEIQATYPETRFYKQALHISNKHSNNMKKQLENKVINRDNEYQFLRNIATQLKCPLMLNNFNYGGIYICYKKEVITSWI